jgi:hypothetical protein
MDMMEWFKRHVRSVTSLNQKNNSVPPPAGLNLAGRAQLVKPKPITLVERYRILEDPKAVEQVFQEVSIPILDFCDRISSEYRATGQGSKVIWREIGRTDDRRSYLYLKPMSQGGLLMERNGAGWRMSRAEKIIGADMFMRSHQAPWDLVTVWFDSKGDGLHRIQSDRFGMDLVAIPVYVQKLRETLGDIFRSGQEI